MTRTVLNGALGHVVALVGFGIAAAAFLLQSSYVLGGVFLLLAATSALQLGNRFRVRHDRHRQQHTEEHHG